jgi:triacylglycerol lipase
MVKARPISYMDHAVQKWLKSDGVVAFTANTLELLNAALLYVIKKVINLAGIAIVTAAAGTLTLMDRMAMLLARGAKVSAELSSWVFFLVKKMASLIGLTIKAEADLTVELIRMVFLRVHQRISNMIWRIGQEIK